MEPFTFYQPTRLEFGNGKLDELGRMTSRYGTRCLLVTTSGKEAVLEPLYTRVKEIFKKEHISYVHFDEVIPNPSIKGIEKAIQILKEEHLEVIVAVGGGSSIDTAKAISLFHQGEVNWEQAFASYTDAFAAYPSLGKKIPVIAVPTTAGTGSEMTQAMVLSDPDRNEKMCIFHQDAFPDIALVDPELTRTLPPYLTAITGFDAFTHSFESYMRECSSDYTRTIGLHAMKMIIQTLPLLVQNTSDMELRGNMAKAASYSGISLSNAAASIPHPLSEIIGGIVPRIAHGQCLACLYPAYLSYICKKEMKKCAVIAGLFDPAYNKETEEKAAAALPGLVKEFILCLGIGKKLSDFEVTRDQLKEMKQHPVLEVLPFAPAEVLADMLEQSYKEGK